MLIVTLGGSEKPFDGPPGPAFHRLSIISARIALDPVERPGPRMLNRVGFVRETLLRREEAAGDNMQVAAARNHHMSLEAPRGDPSGVAAQQVIAIGKGYQVGLSRFHVSHDAYLLIECARRWLGPRHASVPAIPVSDRLGARTGIEVKTGI